MTRPNPAQTADPLSPSPKLAVAGIAWLLLGYSLVPRYHYYQVIMALVLWFPAAIYAWRNSETLKRILGSPAGLFFVAFSAWSITTLAWSQNPRPYSEFRNIAYSWLSLIPIMLLARFCPEKIISILRIGIPVAAIMATLGAINFYVIEGHAISSRLEGLWELHHPELTGRYFSLFVLSAFTVLPKRKLFSPLYFTSLIIFIAAIFLSQDRSVWGALVIAVVAHALLNKQRQKIVLLASLAAVAIILLMINPATILQRGLSYRPTLWHEGFELWKQHFFLGIGQGTRYLLPLESRGIDRYHAHNLFLHIAISLGAVGITLFTALWLACGKRLWQARHGMLGQCALLWWIFSSIAFSVDGPQIWCKPQDTWLQVWLTVAIALGLNSKRDLPEPDHHD